MEATAVTAAARPPRGHATCSCCEGNGSHRDGSECTACQGLGHRPQTETEHCPGRPPLRRRHWRQPHASWAPDKGIFGPTTGMDPRLFDEAGELRPEVRGAIMEKLDQALRVDGGATGSDWQDWTRVYLAGGSASEWAGERPNETAQDLDILIGVDYKDARGTSFPDMDPEEITTSLNATLRAQFNEPGWEAPFGGYWDVTAYVNPRAWSIEVLKPYAAYDLTDMRWAVRPPHLPGHSAADFDKGVLAEARAVTSWARGILRIEDPTVRRREARGLWETIHRNRDRAFSDEGDGWQDPGNLVEKWLAYANGGLLDKIRELAYAGEKTACADTRFLGIVGSMGAVTAAEDSLENVRSKGYCTDEWSRWQQGQCGTYAHALTKMKPHLRFGAAGTEDFPDSHFFAHDDTHAYDSAGKHPLPYRGVHGTLTQSDLDQDPGDWGIPDEESGPEGPEKNTADAQAHARRNRILEGGHQRTAASSVAGMKGAPGEQHTAAGAAPKYHGTTHYYRRGDLISPGGPGAYKESSPDHVYMTEDPGLAAQYAGMRDNPQPEHTRDERYSVYHVEPTGPFERDPQHGSSRPEGYDEEPNYRSTSPLRVIRRMPYTHDQIRDAGVPRKTAAGSDGDRFVTCSKGHEHWGVHGAAGLLLRCRDGEGPVRYLLQKRSAGVDHPGQWSVPSGAKGKDESPEQGAEREFREEMGRLPIGSKHSHTVTSTDCGDWQFHTAVYDAPSTKLPRGHGETEEEMHGSGWFTPHEIKGLPLHPAFEKSWDTVRRSKGPVTAAAMETGGVDDWLDAPTPVESDEQTSNEVTASVGSSGTPYYYGTLGEHQPGDEIYHHYWAKYPDHDRDNSPLYTTTDPSLAGHIADLRERQNHGQKPGRMYQVSPTGPLRPDEVANPSIKGAASWQTGHPLRVEREIPRHEWPSDLLSWQEPHNRHEAASDTTVCITIDVPEGLIHNVDDSVDYPTHITVTYCGKHLDEDSFEEVLRRAEDAARRQPGPLTGTLSGLDTFDPSNSSDGKVPAFIPANIPGIRVLHKRLEDLSASEHSGYVPHMTLGYFDHGDKLPSPHHAVPITFTHLTVRRGEHEQHRFPFGGARNV